MMGLVADGGEPLKVTGGRVSDNLFRTLGAQRRDRPHDRAGRQRARQQRVAVLSDALWRTRFGADPRVIGRGVQLDQEAYTIVGVMPPGFEVFGPGTDLWAPLPWQPDSPQFKATFSLGVGAPARGVTSAAATRELRRSRSGDAHSSSARPNDWGRTLRVQSLQDTITGDVRPALLILLGAVGLILMLAAVNLGTLVLGRSIERVSEMAVRTALGASRRQLGPTDLVEQAVLAVLGAAAGHRPRARSRCRRWSRASRPKCPASGRSRSTGRVLVSVLTVVGRGRRGRGADARGARGAARTCSRCCVNRAPPIRRHGGARSARWSRCRSRSRWCSASASMLMLRSLWNLQRVDPGFIPHNVLTFRLQTTSKYRDAGDGLPYLEQVGERVAALPGVTDVGLAGHLPMSGYSWTTAARRADRPLAPGATAPSVGWRFVARRLLSGDAHSAEGRAASSRPPITPKSPQVAIVNETLGAAVFRRSGRRRSARRWSRSGRNGEDEPLEVVGVIGDVRHGGLDSPPAPGAVPAARADVHVPDGDGGAHRGTAGAARRGGAAGWRTRSIRWCRWPSCSRRRR